MNNMFQYHIEMPQYEQPEELQHLINSYNKLDIQCMNVKWKDNKPEFNIIVQFDNKLVKKMIMRLSQLIIEARDNNDFTEVLHPSKLRDIIQAFDSHNETHLFERHAEQLKQIEQAYCGYTYL